MPFLPIVALPDIPAPFMKWPYAPPPPPKPPPPPDPKSPEEPPDEPAQEKKDDKKKESKMDVLKKAAKTLAKQPAVPLAIGAASLMSKPNDGKAPTAGGDENGGAKCGKC